MIHTRELILEILLETAEEGRYCHLVLQSVLLKHQYLEKRERAFITRVSEGTLERMIELDYIIDLYSSVKTKKMKPLIRNLLRMSVYQLKYMDSVPASAACNEAVKLARKRGFSSLAGFVNGVLRKIAGTITNIPMPDKNRFPIRYASVRYSMPEWLIEQWNADYGCEKTMRLLEVFEKESGITVRPNLAKVTTEELLGRLSNEQVKAERIFIKDCETLDYGLKISGFDYLNALDSFREGLFYVQDIGSMFAVELAAPKAGDYVIDVCAAPGGKALLLAEKLNQSGTVEARDLTEYKTGLIEENKDRYGVCNLHIRKQDARILTEDSVEKADLVMADLPCSGLGVMRKKPDIRYHMTPEKEAELAKLQREILDTVCAYVKKGGVLLYSTCTMNRMENEENVEWFLSGHSDFELIQMRQIFPEEACGDGFFAAKMRRN